MWSFNWKRRADTSLPRPTGRRGARPRLETCEERLLLSVAPHSHGVVPVAAEVRAAALPARPSPLSRYRVFEATIVKGPHRGLTLQGPLVIGYTGRIQVYGVLYPSSGGRPVAAVGTVYGGAVALRFVLPQGGALEVVGSGRLQSVRAGIPGGESLVGLGNVSGPSNHDAGAWETLAPSRIPTA